MKPRGFATLSKDELRKVCSNGGKKAVSMGVGHRFTTETARAAGSIGGYILSQKRGSEYMRELAKKAVTKRKENRNGRSAEGQ